MLEYVYTRHQAIEDGFLVSVTDIAGRSIVFTANLFLDGYEDTERRNRLIDRGLKLLKIPDVEDSEAMKLRVIEKNKIWVIQDTEGVCFLRPDDY
jgi:hypothetical protein